MKDRDKAASLSIGKAEILGDERQKDIEAGDDPVRRPVAEPDQKGRPLPSPLQARQSFYGGVQPGILAIQRTRTS